MAKGKFLRHTRAARFTHSNKNNQNNKPAAPETRSVTIASATMITRRQMRDAVTSREWQAELWDFFDEVGELRFAVRWLANAISRCTLYIGHACDESGEPIPVEPTGEDEVPCRVLEALDGGRIGQAEMLRRLSLHLSLPGESYLVGVDPQPDAGITQKSWYVASSDELTVSSRGDSTLVLPDTGQSIKLSPDNSTIIRLWIPHPRRGSEPDSAVRATLPVLREIRGLSDHISATIDSRLAGAGILAIPSSATFPNPQQSAPGTTNPMHGDEFINSLMQHMITPIRDRDDASAVVPMVIRVPDDAIGKIQHITLSTDLSEQVAQLRKDALERFAAGADLPRDVVTGNASTLNHWNIWQLEESSIKLHVEPLVAVICDALTRQFLHPTLTAMGIDDPERWVVWYNAAELSQRPNKSAEAQALWDKGVLSTEALLRENGFPVGDLPANTEHHRWLIERLVMANPGLYPYLEEAFRLSANTTTSTPAPALAPPAPNITSTAPRVDTGESDPGSRRNPGGVPENSQDVSMNASANPTHEATWWLVAVEQITLRALELAGKRILRTLPRSNRHWQSLPRQVHPWDIHTVVDMSTINDGKRTDEEALDRLMESAFETAFVNFGEDECVMHTLESYVRHLIQNSQPHRREYLATWLTQNGCLPANR